MRIKTLTAAAAALAMVAAPVAASANPAKSLSVARSVRASAGNKDASKLGTTSVVISLVLAAIFVAAIVLPDSLDDGPSSP